MQINIFAGKCERFSSATCIVSTEGMEDSYIEKFHYFFFFFFVLQYFSLYSWLLIQLTTPV